MNHRYLFHSAIVFFVLTAGISAAASDANLLFVKARNVGCGPQTHVVAFAEIADNGQVVVFGDLVLSTNAKSEDEIGNQLTDIFEQRHGYRPESIQVIVVPGSDKETITRLLQQHIRSQKISCPPRILPPASPQMDLPDRQPDYRIA